MATPKDDGVRISITVSGLKLKKAKKMLELLGAKPNVVVRENGGNGGE